MLEVILSQFLKVIDYVKKETWKTPLVQIQKSPAYQTPAQTSSPTLHDMEK